MQRFPAPWERSGAPSVSPRWRLAASRDFEDLDLVAVHVGDVADALADEAARERCDIGNRSGARIGFILAHNPVCLAALAIAQDRHAMPEPNRLDALWLGPKDRARQPLREIAGVPRGELKRPASLVRVLDPLRGLQRFAAFGRRALKRFQARFG
jgi:hypothetical protein